MPSNATPKTLIAGGGPAAIEAALTLREVAPDVDVELLTADEEYVYRPLSVVEPFARGGVRRYPYAMLVEVGATVRHGRLQHVDADLRRVRTDDGADIGYDALLIATGAKLDRTIPKAMTFSGPGDIERMHGLVQDMEAGYVRTLAFVAPVGARWTLPLYELALQTAERAGDLCLDTVEITLVSLERRPLEVFGDGASALMERLLAQRHITFVSGDAVPDVDRVVALPRPSGNPVPGLPCDAFGFLPVDGDGALEGVRRVWAAGDCTDHPLKQGGLATQQAAAAAASIATRLNCAPPVEHDDLILRAMFVDGRQAYFLRRRLDGLDPGQASSRALWWPPAKIAGRRLAPFLDRVDAAQARRSFERQNVEGSVRRRLFVPTVHS